MKEDLAGSKLPSPISGGNGQVNLTCTLRRLIPGIAGGFLGVINLQLKFFFVTM